MTIAIIPARGGSKGIPMKNLREVHGISLLEQAIDKCRRAGLTVAVSSDHDDILREAHLCHAIPIKRPDELATDESTTVDAVLHVFESLGLDPDERIVLVQCTAPHMTIGDIERTAAKTDCDLAIACHRFHGVVLNDSGKCLNDMVDSPRRQDIQQWIVSGSVWAFEASYLNRTWYTGTIGIVESESPRHLEIDDWHDLAVAQSVTQSPPDELWRKRFFDYA